MCIQFSYVFVTSHTLSGEQLQNTPLNATEVTIAYHCNVCIMARQGGLKTTVLMEICLVSGGHATRMCIEFSLVFVCFRMFWNYRLDASEAEILWQRCVFNGVFLQWPPHHIQRSPFEIWYSISETMPIHRGTTFGYKLVVGMARYSSQLEYSGLRFHVCSCDKTLVKDRM